MKLNEGSCPLRLTGSAVSPGAAGGEGRAAEKRADDRVKVTGRRNREGSKLVLRNSNGAERDVLSRSALALLPVKCRKVPVRRRSRGWFSRVERVGGLRKQQSWMADPYSSHLRPLSDHNEKFKRL